MADADTLETPADDAAPDDGVFDIAIDQFHAICAVQQEERALCLQDRRFASIAGAQWEGDWGDQFANSIMVEIDKIGQGLEKINDDYRANRVTVEFRPKDDAEPGSSETAETLNGLFLADVYASKGQQAFDGAFEEAIQGGMGAWRLVNEYADEYDPDDDSQRICFKWIPDADQSVFFDPDARLYDKSDAKYCFVISALSPEQYKAEYDDDPASWPQDLYKAYYDWYTPDVVRVAEYYRVEEKTEDRLSFTHTLTGETRKLWRSELDHGDIADMKVQGWRQMGRKPVKRRLVRKYTFSAIGMLTDPQVIAGDQIPVVPVYGKRWFIDNMERVRGYVRPSKDRQRAYNAMVSKLIEMQAITPIERPIFYAEQIAGHEQAWANANIERHPFSVINRLNDDQGNPLPATPIGTVSPPQVPPVAAALIQLMGADLAEMSASQDGADEAKSNVSAEAMDIAATRTDAKTFTYIDNMRQSMQRCGEIYESMAGDVYVEEGRKVPTMDEDGQHSTAVLLQPQMDDKGRHYLSNDFASAKLNVISDVTEATSTRRDKTVRALTATAQAVAPFDPQMAAAMIGVAVMNMDGEGVSDLSAWSRQRLVQQGVVKPTDEEKEQMAQAAAQAQNQPPSPQAQVLQAQTEKEQALTEKAKADTTQSLAMAEKYRAEATAAHHGAIVDTVKAAQDAHATELEAAQKDQQHRVSVLDKVLKFFGGQAKQADGQ